MSQENTFDSNSPSALPSPVDRSLSSSPPARPLSGPGASRQTRRLQLRNAGFRAAALPSRRVTPNSLSGNHWSSIGGMHYSSDAENRSPSGAKLDSEVLGRRRSSGILQEIGNSTLTRSRPKHDRPRVSSAGFGPKDYNYEGPYTDSPTSPPPPTSTIRPRSGKKRALLGQKRRSISAEKSKYIEHLEAELALAQSHLSTVTSPSATKEQSSRVRILAAEAKQLRGELADWEARYGERVQQELDRHFEIESSLRSHIRALENNQEEARYRIQELESEVASASQNMKAIEIAKSNLEKRVEIMSELLAASPTKIDLHTETPGMRKRHIRPKSMLPRFPTAGFLMQSPERQPQTQPTSPLITGATFTSSPQLRSIQPRLALDTSFPHSDLSSDAASVFSEVPMSAADSMTSVDGNPDHPRSAFNIWTTQAGPVHRSRPVRRMRRFGAGSIVPKSLILPSTTHCDHVPDSAPLLERGETNSHAFASSEDTDTCEEHESPSFAMPRRRALTTAKATDLRPLDSSPLSTSLEETADDNSGRNLYPTSTVSQPSTRDLSSLGSAVGRNLMEELSAARSDHEAGQASGSGDDLSNEVLELESPLPASHASFGDYLIQGFDGRSQGAVSAPATISPATPVQCHVHQRQLSRGRNASILSAHKQPTLQRLRNLFEEIWRSPVAFARHLVQTAQAKLRIPEPLRDVQWWLVGLLLGPMARRRNIANRPSEHACCEHCVGERQSLLDAGSSSRDNGRAQPEDEAALAYGFMYRTPPASSSRAVAASGKGRKPVGGRRCGHHRAKHSPWLWVKFSLTLAFAVGVAFKDGPGSLLKATACLCRRHGVKRGPEETDESDWPASGTSC